MIERERPRHVLQASEDRARLLLDRANDAFVESDIEGVITAWNQQAERTFGWPAAEVLGRRLSELIIPVRLRAAHEAGMRRLVSSGGSRLDGRRVQLAALRRSGEEFPVELSLTVTPGDDEWHIHAFLQDISERVAAEQALTEQKSLLDAVVDGLTEEGVAACDADGRMVVQNRALRTMFDLAPEAPLPEQWFDGLVTYDEDGVLLPLERYPLYRAFAGETVESETVLRGPVDGPLRRLVTRARPLRAPDGTPLGAMAAYHDVTAQTQAESVLAHQTRHDPETDLPNALALREHLVGDRAGSSPVLLLVRLDDLEAVTTGSGAAEGRALIVEAAARLKAVVRPEDLVARSASDELAVLVQDAGPSPRCVVDRVLTSFEAPRDVAGQPMKISVTIGGVTVAEDDEDPLRRAGLALCAAKAAGRGQVEMFRSGMESIAAQALSLRSDLERAFEQGEFELRYQPQVHLRTGTIRGVEALLRWRHPTRGMVPPDQFIPLTEQMGIIRPLGRWILLEACQQLRVWADAGLPELRMAVNLSAMQLEPRLVEDVRAALAGSGLNGRLLELEITETVAVRQGSGALAVLRGLRQLGATLSVDDFGTGYSMLDQLRTFPFTQLKIDKSFVQDLDDFGRAPLVEAIIAMSRALGLEVVAEGVETVAQLNFLQDQDCDLAQGYLLSRPADADQITALLRQSEPLPGFASAVEGAPDCADWLSDDAALQFVRPIL